MAGMDENVAVLGDWAMAPNPSPRTFFSSFLSDDVNSISFPDLLGNNGIDGPFQRPEKQQMGSNSEDDKVGGGVPGDCLSESGDVFSGHKLSSRGGLAERVAARAGFNAPRLNTARIRSSNMLPSSSPEVRSPYLTIPPGLSPTSLLESPVLLSNSKVQPSPTTGKFPFVQCNSRSSMSISAVPDKDKDHMTKDADSESFVFKPHVETSSSYFQSVANKVSSATNHHQSFPNIEVSVQGESSIPAQKLEARDMHFQNQQEFLPRMGLPESAAGKDASNVTSDLKVPSFVASNAKHSQASDDREEGVGDQREHPSVAATGPMSEDGYNWRKYGQKQVKGSEYPRSYYKCTHPNCQVKKKVERSHEGHITEIIYKGAHNHPKPPPSRRSVVGSYPPGEMDGTEQPSAHVTFNGETAWASTQHGAVDTRSNWRHDDMETESSASAATELCNPSASTLVQNGPHFESGDAIDVSSTVSNNDDDDDQGTHGSVSLGYDEEGDESESKRRKVDASVMEMTGATRAIREPRVVVQTTSEVDILDDGYRWRKYGQKVVKGNPNPRSYYKCTNAGCTVRKHVERASHDLKSVITTYEGKHNHDVPAARNSSHVSNGHSGIAATPASQTNTSIPEPSQAHDGMSRFTGPASLNSFGIPSRQTLGPNPGFSFGINQPGPANLAVAGFASRQGKMPVLPVHSYLGQQQKVNEGSLMMPKGEPKEELISEPSLPISNRTLYHQILSRLSVGNQL
eukprot:TRINITY_DN6728_c0_g1_i1.p1 TRINITY_DN6728_c0_g1~~TRINITY_DN6728_c0_g1_i1.p1  ORF type:complete len:741 (-),score=186.62 TRINITY_DN6728_c0_g1_i1:224-2446(-)